MYTQTTIPLYPDRIPNSKPVPNTERLVTEDGVEFASEITIPTLTIFSPTHGRENGTAIIICPGGGYWVNATSHEGFNVAQRFVALGITAFVLKYRIPNPLSMFNPELGPLQDAQQAILTVRRQASELKFKHSRVGIMGFSAGGHVASTAGTHYKRAVPGEGDDLRPDFMMLIYPVISFQEEVAHVGSRNQLLGGNPIQEKIDMYSNELQVDERTPPSFLVHASDDGVVSPDNSILFYKALLRKRVRAELHLYQEGGHGFGLINRTTEDEWFDRGVNWLKANRWL